MAFNPDPVTKMSRILFHRPSPLPPLGLCLLTRSPSLQGAACDLRIPPLAWSRLIRAAHLLGAPRTTGTGTGSRRGGMGSPPGLAAASFGQDWHRGDKAGGTERNSCLPFKTDLTYKIIPDLRKLPISFHELGFLFAVDW